LNDAIGVLKLVTILHGDHGQQGQFTGWAFTARVREYGIRPSRRRIADCYGNAMIEFFWGANANRRTERQNLGIVIELGPVMAKYIDNFQNTPMRDSLKDTLAATKYENYDRT
jgi:transposase InsO family protein